MGNLNMRICVKKSNGSAWKNGTIMQVQDGNILLNGSLISPHIYRTLEEINNCFLCEFEEFEEVEEEEEKQTPKDLLLELSKKNRIVVEFKNGKKALMMTNGDLVNQHEWVSCFSSYDSCLNSVDCKSFDIYVVYSSSQYYYGIIDCFKQINLSVLWKRELPKYTLEELYGKVGHKFELQD